jgi:hypothetical protein
MRPNLRLVTNTAPHPGQTLAPAGTSVAQNGQAASCGRGV